MGALDGKACLVTGGATGIGLAVAKRLTQEGARVAISGRDAVRLEREAKRVGAVSAPMDVRDAASILEAITVATNALGDLHVLVNNAGVGGANEPGEADRWNEILDTNLTGAYHVTRAALDRWAPGPEPRHIVMISSILGRIGVPGYTAYCASKAGMLGLVRALAMELAPDGTRVNAVCPGWVDTDMAWQGLDAMAAAMDTDRDGAWAEAARDVPLGKMATPGDVAAAVAFLVGEGGASFTGQALDLNNGSWMG